jgi:hypothetical protein
MKLLVLVVEDVERVEDFLSAVVTLGVASIQVVDGSTVMDVLAREAPIFAGLRELLTRPKAKSRIILGVTEGDILPDLDRVLKRVDLDLEQPGTGYALQLAVDSHLGHLDLDEP